MRHVAIGIALLALSLGASAARAGTIYTLQPNPPDLYDLDHSRYYTWGIDRPWDANRVIVGASLTFLDIRNWDSNPNVLYVHLLEDAPLGVRSHTDNQSPADAFGGQGLELVTYRNLPASPQTLTHTFSLAELAWLQTCAADGRFALGFDPDCHFYNSGVRLEVVTTTSVPEPAAMVVMVAGGLVVLARRRRRRS